MMKAIYIVITAIVFCGCQSARERQLDAQISASNKRQTQKFHQAIPADIVAQRIKEGNWRFLGYFGGMLEESYIPGLNKEEIKEFIDSGQY